MARFTAKVLRFDVIGHDKWGMPEADDDDQNPAGNFLMLKEFIFKRI